MASKQRLDRKIALFLFLALCISSVFAVSYFRLLDNYELETLDMRFRVRPLSPTTDKIALIDIADDSLKKIGRFPFDRNLHAVIVKALTEAGAKAIIFDFVFSEPSKKGLNERGEPYDYDMDFADAMRESGRVYLPFYFLPEAQKRGAIYRSEAIEARPLDVFRAFVKGEGHINVSTDIDGKYRRIPPYIRCGNTLYPYISVLAACNYLGIPQKSVKIMPGKYLKLGDYAKVPLDDYSNIIVNYSGKWADVFKHYSYVDILQSYFAPVAGQKPILDLRTFKDRVCIIGVTAGGTCDIHPNPFEPLYPAVGIHAEIFNSFINKKFISRASRFGNMLILLILSAAVTFFATRLRPVKGILMLLALEIAFAASAVSLFNYFGIWIDILYPSTIIVVLYLFVTIYRYISEWKKRLLLENELDIAKRIQESFLPKTLPQVGSLEIAASMFTARKVGGDLYDFIQFGQDKLGVMIGDVSGKGIPASLFMAMVSGAFKFFATADAKPEDVLSKLNSKIVKESTSNLFVTMFYLFFDVKEMKMSFANGGHLPVVHVQPGEGKLDFLDTSDGTPLGLIDGPYSGKTVSFRKGDSFVLYTDGVTEAMDKKNEMYGKDRLAKVISDRMDAPAKSLMHAIEKDVRKFEPVSSQHDDITVIVIRVD